MKTQQSTRHIQNLLLSSFSFLFSLPFPPSGFSVYKHTENRAYTTDQMAYITTLRTKILSFSIFWFKSPQNMNVYQRPNPKSTIIETLIFNLLETLSMQYICIFWLEQQYQPIPHKNSLDILILSSIIKGEKTRILQYHRTKILLSYSIQLIYHISDTFFPQTSNKAAYQSISFDWFYIHQILTRIITSSLQFNLFQKQQLTV